METEASGEAASSSEARARAEASAPTAERPALSLVVHTKGGQVQRHRLDPWRVYTFGRAPNADLQLDDDRVSRIHGSLFFHDGWVVADANSSNGTFVVDAASAAGASASGPVPNAAAVAGREPLAVGMAILPGSRWSWLEIVLDPAPPAMAPRDADDQHLSAAARAFDLALASAARHRRNVLLVGPTGAGKTHAAELIHARSGATGRFVAVNCAGLPTDPTQLRSVLFGHKKGSFTGAASALLGYVYAAVGGTLFLDEVESLSREAQGFLLDVLERRGPLLPLGADPAEAVAPPELRVIAASKARLGQSGLRRDLQFRLADGDLIAVPSLAQRLEDLPGLARAFLDVEAAVLRRRARLLPEAVQELQAHAWPGELRQLRATVTACLRGAADEQSPPSVVLIDAARVRARLGAEAALHGPEEENAPGADQTRPDLRLPGVTSLPGVGSVNPRRLSAEQVRAALAQHGGNIEHTARWLRISRRTLMARMDALGVERPHRRR